MLSQKDIERIADAVLSRIEELRQIDEIAQAVVRELRGNLATGSAGPLMNPNQTGVGRLLLDECTPYTCQPNNTEYSPCAYPYTCPNTQAFDCSTRDSNRCTRPGEFVFDCLDDPYNCPGSTKYTCDDGIVIDFRCYHANFQCGGTKTFECAGNHVFKCGSMEIGIVHTFTCNPKDSTPDFTCRAGRGVIVPCNGDYSVPDPYEPSGVDTVPGDFSCQDTFNCTDKLITCNAQDDFNCTESFKCTPKDGTKFDCTGVGGTFDCVSGSAFTED